MALPKVDVIVLNFNGIKHTPACVTSLYKNTSYPFRLVVVDNFSADGSREWLRKHENLPNLTTIYNEEPDGGFSAGNNKALKQCNGDYAVLLNNDTLVIDPDWLHKLTSQMEADKSVAVQGCKLLYPSDMIQHAGVTYAYDDRTDVLVSFHRGRFDPRQNWGAAEKLPAVTFACVMLRRTFLDEVGGLDEAYGLGNYEDIDLCCQARKRGHGVLYNGGVELYHYEGATQLSRPDQKGWYEHIGKNLKIFQDRWREWLKADIRADPALYKAGIQLQRIRP
jgi:GT2 family glycosyltransferase